MFLNLVLPKVLGCRTLRFLSVSEELADRIQAIVSEYPIEVLHNAIPIEELQEAANFTANQTLHRLHAAFHGHPTVVQVGTLDSNKNQIFTLECIRQLKDQIPNIRCLLIGTGPMMSDLIDWVSRHDLSQNVLFTGPLARMDCLYLIRRADVLVLTSESEAFPLALVEAQALSLPVVSFDVGGVREIVDHGITGYLVRKNDHKMFQSRLKQLLLNKHLSCEMGQRGKKKMRKYFTMKKKVDKLLNMIHRDRQALFSYD